MGLLIFFLGGVVDGHSPPNMLNQSIPMFCPGRIFETIEPPPVL